MYELAVKDKRRAEGGTKGGRNRRKREDKGKTKGGQRKDKGKTSGGQRDVKCKDKERTREDNARTKGDQREDAGRRNAGSSGTKSNPPPRGLQGAHETQHWVTKARSLQKAQRNDGGHVSATGHAKRPGAPNPRGS